MPLVDVHELSYSYGDSGKGIAPVSLAVMARQPELLVLDEPFSMLDPLAAERLAS